MPMEGFVTKEVHEEFVKRMEADHETMKGRILKLEQSDERQTALIRAVDKLALNMEQMLNEQKSQGERLDVLESRDGEMWRKVVGYAVTAIVGIVVGYIFKQFGM